MTLDQAAAQTLIDIVRHAARTEILPRFRMLDPDAIDTKSGPDDLVTIADKSAEKVITQGVAKAFPEATIVGEEAVAEDASLLKTIGNAEMAVIIDPIDGTWNFARNLNQFGVIVAVVSRGETVLGLLYDPLADDWVMARKGEGAWYGRPDGTARRLQVSNTKKVSNMVGSTSIRLFPRETQYDMAGLFPDFARMMSFGCACHEYRTMAFGFVDFMLTAKLMPWDHAAGVMILQEAGGYAALLDGTPYSPTIHQGCMIAANSKDSWENLREKFDFLID
ncbi:inositol monophosphatase [Kushneria pakistanensis]|uniref:Inositol monophosphatase n=1 Tax=Kushneria pakistanensis TaxID=1508770 RepID=A0ABQ3FGB3_9GAMM|nr:inositol monophosphatase [Kushneria pakistanensis]GHC22973.1 inositol monophosphatase [Kushneria pakistanensis]